MSQTLLKPAIISAAAKKRGSGSGIAIASTSQGSAVEFVTSFNLTLPTGIQTGDLLVIFRRHNVTTQNLNPTGWTILSEFSSNGCSSIYYRVADGSEGSTVTIPSGTTSVRDSACICHRITGALTSTPPEAATWATGVDAGAVSPSWGSAENLYIPIVSHRLNTNIANAVPSGFGGYIYEQSGSGATSRAAIANGSLLETSASKDPGAWSITGVLNIPHTSILAIRPA